MCASRDPPVITIVPMKKSAKSHLSLIFKFISGMILSFLSYLIIYNFRRVPIFDLDAILPPNGHILKSIAVPRVSGTAGNFHVREFIKSQFPLNFWDIEEDVHAMNTPHGQSTQFVNLIVTLKTKSVVKSDKRLILAAHYDSKLLEAEGKTDHISTESTFIGASDSAWSCALMIAVAQAIQKENSRVFSQNFQLIFFDGEEAVHHWSPSDSLFGSRALASKWSKLPKESPNSLDKISLMVLLDLLGTKDGNKFYSFYPENSLPDREFQELSRIEQKDYVRLFQSSNQFKAFNGQAVEDDHTPFLPFNVPVLHLIPVPFPSVWHTPADTIEALDPENCEIMAKIIYKYIRNKLM